MADRHPPNPDAAQLPPDEVREAFLDALENDIDDEDLGRRLAERARLVLEQRPLAADAQGFAVALIGWAAREVLPALDARALDLPAVSSWDDVAELASELGSHVRDLRDAWSDAYRSRRDEGHDHGSDRDEYASYQTFEHVERAADALRRIPNYRLTDPNWKAKRERPTPLSLCAEAAAQIAWALSYALDIAPDAEGALDRLGLGPADTDVSARAVRARRALRDIGFSAPGARLVTFAEILAGVVAVSPDADARQLAERALDATPDSAARIAGEDPALAARPLAQPVSSVAEAARASLIEIGVELVRALAAELPHRAEQPLQPSQSTPVQDVSRPSQGDLAMRLIRSLESKRRTPSVALAELRKLTLPDDERDRVLDAIVAATLRSENAYGELVDLRRLGVGAFDGPLTLGARAQSGLHLWKSDSQDDADTPQFAQALCGASLASGRVEIIHARPQRATDGRGVFGSHVLIGYSTRDCAQCVRLADQQGLLDAQPDRRVTEEPADLRAGSARPCSPPTPRRRVGRRRASPAKSGGSWPSARNARRPQSLRGLAKCAPCVYSVRRAIAASAVPSAAGRSRNC